MPTRRRFPFRLSVQTVLPADFETNEPFHHSVEGLRDPGLWGLEPSIRGIDFARLFRTRQALGYQGRFAIEGKLKSGLVNDIAHRLAYFAALSGGARETDKKEEGK